VFFKIAEIAINDGTNRTRKPSTVGHQAAINCIWDISGRRYEDDGPGRDCVNLRSEDCVSRDLAVNP
jgi:hypothetical protein